MNRAQRRAQAKTATAKRLLPRAPWTPSHTSTEVCEAICRVCRRQRQVFLPGRICGRCIEHALELAAVTKMDEDQAQQMLAAIAAEELADG